jgi:hypothetical protein
VTEILGEEIKDLRKDLELKEDGILLSEEVEKAFKDYDYDVSPEPEGQDDPGLTPRLTGGSYLIGRTRPSNWSPDDLRY